VQIGLVRRYEVSAWKLGGFGMYAVPFPRPAELFTARPSRALEPVDPRALPPFGLDVVGRYQARRQLLGRLADVQAAAEALAGPAGGPPFKLAFRTIQLSRDGYFRERWSGYLCEAAHADAPLFCRDLGSSDRPP
jgi:hypothetical protein